MKNQLISVIIPTFNEQKDIENCLLSLKSQTYKPLEIIAVDDGSRDRTVKIMKNFKGVKLLRQSHKGPGSARNKGALKAKGEIFVFVDADMTFDKRFIDKLTKPIREKKVIGTFSKNEFVSNSENRWARNWSINQNWQEGRMHTKKHPNQQDVFRAIRADKFRDVGGFDTKVGYTDDWSLANKLKIQAEHADGAIFFHKNPETLKEAFVQAKWSAKRPYKLGLIGQTLALFRVSFPISLVIGFGKSVRYLKPSFILFKLVVDLASFIGISSLFLRRKRVK